MTHQKNSGRCWIFAMLNAARIPFMKKYHLDEFEFSQSFLFYYDKVCLVQESALNLSIQLYGVLFLSF